MFPLGPEKVGAYFLECNRGKRSMTAHVTSTEGRAIVQRLVDWADVVVANLPDESLAAMGLDWDSVHARNPRVVLVTATTFGTTGPYAGRLGFDGVGQAMSGAVHLTGPTGQAFKSFVPWVDFSTGALLAAGALAALVQRDRTGRGQRVEGSLLGTALAASGAVVSEQAVHHPDREATGNRHPAAGPSDIVATKDGQVIVQVIGDAMFARWCRVIDRSDLVDDPRFTDDEGRGTNGEALSDALREWCATRTTAQALAELAAGGIPAGPVLSPQAVLDDPHVRAAMLDAAVGAPGSSDRFPSPSIRCGCRSPAPSWVMRPRRWVATPTRCWPSWATPPPRSSTYERRARSSAVPCPATFVVSTPSQVGRG